MLINEAKMSITAQFQCLNAMEREREKKPANPGRPQQQQQVHACMPHSILSSFMSNVCIYYKVFFSFASIISIENMHTQEKNGSQF